jgi:group I intron endonuclease
MERDERWGRFPAALHAVGFDAFTWEQIDTAATPEDLDRKEQNWIARFNSTDPAHGYNVSPGGGLVALESRQKISKAGRGKPKSAEHRRKIGEANKGKRHNEKTWQKLKEIQTGKYGGKDNPFYGKHHTAETRRKMKEAWKRRRTRPVTEETRRKQRESRLRFLERKQKETGPE